jgi:predicted lipase
MKYPPKVTKKAHLSFVAGVAVDHVDHVVRIRRKINVCITKQATRAERVKSANNAIFGEKSLIQYPQDLIHDFGAFFQPTMPFCGCPSNKHLRLIDLEASKILGILRVTDEWL